MWFLGFEPGSTPVPDRGPGLARAQPGLKCRPGPGSEFVSLEGSNQRVGTIFGRGSELLVRKKLVRLVLLDESEDSYYMD